MESNPSDRVSPVLRTPERKPGAENAGQTYSRNRRKNLADREKIIIGTCGTDGTCGTSINK